MIDREQTNQLLSIFFLQDDKIQVAQVGGSARRQQLGEVVVKETAA